MLKTPVDKPEIKSNVFFGLMALLCFFGIFILWSVISHLESGAVATGKVVVDSHAKEIEHLEGGIVRKIFVKDGDLVEKGDPLIKLDDLQEKARLKIFQGQTNTWLSEEARLIAELSESQHIDFPTMINNQKKDKKVKKLMERQILLFNANNESYHGASNILKQRIEQLNGEIASLQSQVISAKTQLKYINEEVEMVATLERKKLIERPRLLALLREQARLEGERDKNIALIEKTKQKIGETELKLMAIKDNRQKELLSRLHEIQAELATNMERFIAAKDVLDRTLIRSPRRGLVMGMNIHTIGGVIGPGEKLLNLIPSQDQLIIEAKVDPLDIDVVYPGLPAKIRLTAFKQRSTPTLTGKVVTVSADSIADEVTGKNYFMAKIVVSHDDLMRLKRIKLYPGMPAEVLIVTDKRSPFNYFTTPITNSFSKAFREQ